MSNQAAEEPREPSRGFSPFWVMLVARTSKE